MTGTAKANAKFVVSKSPMKLEVLGTDGSIISTLSNESDYYLKEWIKNEYKQKFVDIVDDVFVEVVLHIHAGVHISF